MMRWLTTAFLLLPATAWADVPPDDGGGCRCDMLGTPSLAWIPIVVGILVVVQRMRR